MSLLALPDYNLVVAGDVDFQHYLNVSFKSARLSAKM